LNWLKKEGDRDKNRDELKLSDHQSYLFSTDSQSNSLGTVAIYIDSLQGYGADKTLLKIAEGLAEIDIEIDLVTAKKVGKIGSQINPAINLINFDSSRFNLIKNVFGLTKYLIDKKPAILFSSIHFNNITSACSIMLARLVGVKSKLVVRQANSLEYQLKGYPFPIGTLMYPLIKMAYKKADLIICPSKGLLSDLTKFMKAEESKIKLVYNPTVTADIFIKAQQEVDHRWFKQKSCPIILAAGRLKPQKDFKTLINAFARVKRNFKDAKLVILGEGTQRQELQSLITKLNIQEDVDLVGFQENPYAFIAKADVFVLSSIYEGLPNILIEALALKTKIVATNCPSGPAEILKFGKYGSLLPIDSPFLLEAAIAEALEQQVCNWDELNPVKDFEQKSQVKKYGQIFLNLANNNGPKNPTCSI
ncbi:MAG: glycosyltransferase, partial [Xenococcaceae cyanobacterium]